MDTLPSTSEGIYEEAYGGKRPQACCPRAGYLHPTAEDSTSADPPGHHLSLPGPAGRFTSGQLMAEGTSSDSSEELSEETHVKTPRACCPRAGYLHPSPEDSTSADPPDHRLSLSEPAIRFKSDQQMAVTTSSSPSLEACEETQVKRPKACCPRAGYLHPTAEENTSADPPDHRLSLNEPAGRFKSDQQMAVTTSSSPSLESREETHVKRPKACCPRADYLQPTAEENTSADSPGDNLSMSGPAGRSQSDQQLSKDSSPSTSERIYDQMCRVRCPIVVYLRFPPEHSTSVDPAGGQLSVSRPGGRSVSVRPGGRSVSVRPGGRSVSVRPGGRSVSVRPKSSTF